MRQKAWETTPDASLNLFSGFAYKNRLVIEPDRCFALMFPKDNTFSIVGKADP
jgi:hypothetical protein